MVCNCDNIFQAREEELKGANGLLRDQITALLLRLKEGGSGGGDSSNNAIGSGSGGPPSLWPIVLPIPLTGLVLGGESTPTPTPPPPSSASSSTTLRAATKQTLLDQVRGVGMNGGRAEVDEVKQVRIDLENEQVMHGLRLEIQSLHEAHAALVLTFERRARDLEAQRVAATADADAARLALETHLVECTQATAAHNTHVAEADAARRAYDAHMGECRLATQAYEQRVSALSAAQVRRALSISYLDLYLS